eukprot:423254-Pyramimonas_sp.AAC.1
MIIRAIENGETQSLDKVRVYLSEKEMWLTVWAPRGGPHRYPDNIAIGNIKKEIARTCSHYEGKELFMYDAVDCFAAKAAKHGGYEYLDDYAVKADSI